MRFWNFDWARSPVQFSFPIGQAGLASLAAVPIGILILYFLKLRRRPVQVPSTLLWRRSLEDLHVNSLFQRLRKNLLLFLQLLAALLAILALAGPRVQGTKEHGRRLILVIDNSASMSATDVSPSRLARAKTQAEEIIKDMADDDLAMLIAFNDKARVMAPYTSNRRELLRQVEAIRPSEASTSPRDALQVAAGLANPLKVGDVPQGVVATSVVVPQLKIFTDGGFPDVEGFSLGNLEPEFIIVGPTPPPPRPGAKGGQPSDNVAILALRAARNEEKPDQFQVFGLVHNFRGEAVSTEGRLFALDPASLGTSGRLLDAIALTIKPQSDQGFQFDLPDNGVGAELELRLDVADALEVDNRAFTLVGKPRKAKVLVVTSGNRYLVDTLKTTTAEQMADVTLSAPDQADATTRAAEAGRFDLIIYDRTSPRDDPEANTLYFGALPPGKAYESRKPLPSPIILDWDVAHPLMQYIRDIGLIRIGAAIGVEPPTGSTVLIESNLGPIGFIRPREGYTDTVVTFGQYAGGKLNTDWHLYPSFPLFLFNCLRVLGNAREATSEEVHAPGRPVVLRSDAPGGTIQVIPASGGAAETLNRTPQGTFVYNKAETTGIYHARWGRDGGSAFIVNLFDARESDLSTRGVARAASSGAPANPNAIKIGNTDVTGKRGVEPARKEWWWLIALIALGVVLFEWYVYNRRVYI